MGKIKTDEIRHINPDFERLVKETAVDGPKPETAVIEFRNERIEKITREIKSIPVKHLRFRKKNGRIKSDVLDYEKNVGTLIEDTEECQKILADFLKEKDPEKTEELKNSIFQGGQRDPAIITCDGFLINGNRRKLALEMLSKEKNDTKFNYMKVVILPGKNDPGGPPTNKEIAEIENRYQLQKDGKSEYSGFDQALSIREKIEEGLDLKTQLKDDPQYALLSEKDLNKVVKKYKKDYLEPLKCVDEYLEYLGREQCYKTISAEKGNPEGRWQAFIDYSAKVDKKLNSEKEKSELDIKPGEEGKIKDIAFKIIRQRSFPKIDKVHNIMRDFLEVYKNKDSRKELKSILKVEKDINSEKKIDKEGNPIPLKDQDKLWSNEYGSLIINAVKKAKYIVDRIDENEKPLDILKEALQKLNHSKLEIDKIPDNELQNARKLTVDIQNRASEIEDEIYHEIKEKRPKQKKQLENKFKS